MTEQVSNDTTYIIDCSPVTAVLPDVKVVEDFVPCWDDLALVTAGKSFVDLCYLLLVQWEASCGVIVFRRPIVIREGEHYRLGHLLNGRPKYSASVKGPHQPFHHGDDVYFTHDGNIYRNDAAIIEQCDSFVRAGNPWVDGNTLWFEARLNKAPVGWDLWKLDLTTMQKERVTRGANPCVHDNILYFSLWDDSRGVFDIVVRPL